MVTPLTGDSATKKCEHLSPWTIDRIYPDDDDDDDDDRRRLPAAKFCFRSTRHGGVGRMKSEGGVRMEGEEEQGFSQSATSKAKEACDILREI